VHGSDPTQIWAQLADEEADEMTITLIKREQQYGKPYHVMAELFLPSLWKPEKATALKIGLANALATHFGMPNKEILVITHTVDSGQVIEDGDVVEW
tara:strand:- start:359 stop:649 length:291 start_codon:yes stop_codon:yes gene_type:complete